jgi:hypothetical protein
MSDNAVTSGGDAQIEERADLGKGDAALWQYWEIQEAIADRAEAAWHKLSRKILRRYRDERSPANRGAHQFNILWSNVQTLKPALYGRMPKADCERRWKDQDDVGRLAAVVMERSLNYSVENCGFDNGMRAAVEDLLLPGRGVMRVLYVPHYGDAIKPEAAGDEDGEDEVVASSGDRDAAPAADDAASAPPEPEEAAETASQDGQPPQAVREVVWEEARFKYVHWDDYREGPARQWDEVPWLRYQAFMTRDELRLRFGKAIGDKVTLDYTPKGSEDQADEGAPADAYKKARVHEIWDKSKKQVVWRAPGTPDLILDQLDDPLQVRGFFPQDDPLLATTTTDRRIPVPDYHQYRDQAEELDTLTARIERLQRALKPFGIYPGEEKQTLTQLVQDDSENLLIPVAEWQAFADKGGLEGMIQWFPIKEIAETLIQLYNARDRAKQILYEITGIADIIRAATDPDETLGAQQIKSQFATLRLSERQKMIARLARGTIRIAADVIGTHFSAKTISLMTGYPQLLPLPPQPQPPRMPPELMAPAVQMTRAGAPAPAPQPPSPAAQQYSQAMQEFQQALAQLQQVTAENQKRQGQFDAAVRLIKEDVLTDFRIDIEADSTITVDEQAEKAARTEFLQQMVPLLEQVVPIGQGNPPMAALAKEIVLFATRAFKTGRPLEEALEAAFDAIAKMPPHPDGPGGKGKGGNDQGQIAMAQAKQHDTDVAAQAEAGGDRMDAMVKMQANAIKMRQVEGELALGDRRLAMERGENAVKLAMAHDNAASEQELRSARISSIAARGASGLT